MPARTSELEQQLLDQISQDKLWEYVSTIAKDERMSGSPEEREAMRYVASTLRSWDVQVEEYEHDGYVSEPLNATLKITAPEQYEIDCITHSFGISGSFDGEIVYAGSGSADDYARVDVAGKIALLEGLATPHKVIAAEAQGVAGVICINDHNLHQMIVTPIWGTPTPDTIGELPELPVASIRLEDGNRLRELTESGTVQGAMETEVWTGWAKLPVVVGNISGAVEPDRYVMLAGHIDSWFYGAIDNAAANATTLEVMRVLAGVREQLRRGFRIVIWSGHSHGRYAGSTWYADTFWEELYDGCVAYVNVDSTGATQAELYEEILAMPETADLASGVIKDLTGQDSEVNRVGRAGDQSFWGIGIPSVFMSLSRVPVETAPELSRAMGTLTGRKKSGQAWFWHTEFDTLDKVDLNVLEMDTRIYLSAIFRLMQSPVLPFDYAQTVDELIAAAEQYQTAAGELLDLGPVVDRLRALRSDIIYFQTSIPAEPGAETLAEINQAFIDLGRILVPLNYTESGQFDHDLALHAPALPLLHDAGKLAALDPESDEFRFLQTSLIRRRNQALFTLRQARERARGASAALR